MATRLGLQRWFPEAFKKFGVYTTFDLMVKYIKEGRIKLDKSRHPQLTTYHDPCNYGRKSEMKFGYAYYDEPRWILDQCVENWVDTFPNRNMQFCCGAGGGAWITPYEKERLFYARKKADQLKASKAELLVVACHSCHDQFNKAIRKEYDLEHLEVKYLWHVVADAIVL